MNNPPDNLEALPMHLLKSKPTVFNNEKIIGCTTCVGNALTAPLQKTAAVILEKLDESYVPPAVPEGEGLTLGKSVATGADVSIERQKLTQNVVVTGAVGSGKSSLFRYAAFQILVSLARYRTLVRYLCFKGEGRLLLKLNTRKMLFWLSTLPRNFWQPVGDRKAFWMGIAAEIANAYNLRPETYPLLLAILERIFQGLAPRTPFVSWDEVFRLTELEADKQQRDNLRTIARALFQIAVALGKVAFIRQAPDITTRWDLIIEEMIGIDPRLVRCVIGMQFTYMLLAASETGHTLELKQLYIIDEGRELVGKESEVLGAGYVDPIKRFISMARFLGVGVMVGVQNISQTSAFLKNNVGTVIVFRCPALSDAREAAMMSHLAVTAESLDELMKLPVGTCFVWSVGWERAIKVQVPFIDGGDYPSDEQVRAFVQPELDKLESEIVYAPEYSAVFDPIDVDDALRSQRKKTEPPLRQRGEATKPDDVIRLLEQIAANPNLGKAAHAKLFGSTSKFYAIIDELITQGLVEITEVSATGGRPREVLSITKLAEQFLSHS